MKRLFSLVKGCCEIFLKTFLALRTIEPNRLFSLAFGNFMIRYDISPLDPEAHLFIVGITIDDPTPDEQYLRLPTWIAGSYLIRDFASTIQAEQAFLGETPVPIEKSTNQPGASVPSVVKPMKSYLSITRSGHLILLFAVAT